MHLRHWLEGFFASPSLLNSSRRRHVAWQPEPLEPRTLLSGSPIIIDNSDPDFSDVRTWQDLTGQGNQGTIATADSTVAGAFASWNFSGLDNGQYYLQATWTSGVDRATNATFTSRSEFGSPGRTFTVNQKLTPTADFQSGSIKFQNLGVITITDGKLTVELTNPGADGTIVADAIRLAPVASTDNSLLVRTERLNAITQALKTFQTTYGHLPPVATPSALDANGHYNLSWRVHLLPFLGYDDLYQQFHLNEPWNSANNLPLLNQMPDVFRSLDLAAGSGSTGFQRVDLPGGFHITGAGGPKLSTITDNPATSLLLIETSAVKAVPWTAPDDSPYSPTDPLSIITPAPSDFLLIATADFQIHHLNPNISATDFQSIVTWSGGEILSADRLPQIFLDQPLSADQITRNNLQIIISAMLKYQKANLYYAPGAPSYSPLSQYFDANHNPYLSWRVALLPYLGEQALYSKFHLNEPWDSPNNLPLAALMPDVFRSVGIASGSNTTGYQIFNGPGGYSIQQNKLYWSDLSDGSEKTLAVIELPASSALIWTRADGDIQYNAATPLAGLPQIPAQGLWSVMFDGSVRRLSPQITSADLAALVSWSGHETFTSTQTSKLFVNYPPSESINDRELKLQQLGYALENYHDSYNAFPISYGGRSNYDTDGKPFLSWRVYLLPYLGETNLFSQFHLNEPWNSPNNLPLLDKMPEIFRSRGLPVGTNLTGFQVLAGTTAYYQRPANDYAGAGPSLRYIEDNPSTTILVLETQASQAVEWTRPDGDIPFDPANPLANLDLTGLKNVPADGLLALMTDGSVRNIQPAITPANFSALATWRGLEVIDSVTLGESLFDLEDLGYTRVTDSPLLNEILKSRNQMHGIGAALHNFHDVYNAFPTGNTAFPTNFDASGNQKLSWRVYLLPYLGEGDLFNLFNLNEPWNSPNNLPLLDKMPDFFRTRGLPVGTNLTGIQLISGPAAYNPRVDKTTGLYSINDGPSNTIGAIETPPELAVLWTKPDDFAFNSADPFASIRPYISDYVAAMFFDGAARSINPQTNPADLSALMTWNGGEIVTYDTTSLTPQIQIKDAASKQYRIETDLASLGSSPFGTPLDSVFSVKNTGSQPLVISSLQLPQGFSLVTPLNPIPAGATANLTLRLNGGIGGNFGGLVTINSNVPDQPVLKFTIDATITTPLTLSLPTPSVSENLPGGIVFGQLSTTGPSSSSTYLYTLVSGKGDTDNASFRVDAQGHLKTAAKFDYEARSKYSIRVRTTESSGIVLEQVFTISILNANEAPVLNPTGNPALANITEDAFNSTGTAIKDLIAGTLVGNNYITDPDTAAPEGLALYSAPSSGGNWQYTLNNGGTWNPISGISPTNALLLAADPAGNTRLRFVPLTNFNGTRQIYFRAWDQSSGTNGGFANITTNGGSTPFSLKADSATITVTPVNDAPLLFNTFNPVVPAVNKSAINNPGFKLSSMIASVAPNDYITDVDGGPEGIAIYSVQDIGGHWEYTLDNGAIWTSTLAVSPTSALLLKSDSSTFLRFVPNNTTTGDRKLFFRAWDQSTGTAGTKVDASVFGTTTPFSNAADSVTVTVNTVNDAPVLNPAGNPTLPTISASNTNPAGISILDLIASGGANYITDMEFTDPKGIALYGAPSSGGTWQYSLDSGATWTNVGTVDQSHSLLLRAVASTMIRFKPLATFSGSRQISFSAWDQSTGVEGTKVDTNYDGTTTFNRGGTTAFSLARDTASITIT